jgi:hypothetical protein
MSKATLKNKVDRLLASPLVAAPLLSRGIRVVDVSTPKQTDTTQRWKIGLEVAGAVAPIRTKVEFSRRDEIEGAAFEAVFTPPVAGRGGRCDSARMTAIDITALEASVEALIQQQLAAYEAQLREALARTLSKARPTAPRRKRDEEAEDRARAACIVDSAPVGGRDRCVRRASVRGGGVRAGRDDGGAGAEAGSERQGARATGRAAEEGGADQDRRRAQSHALLPDGARRRVGWPSRCREERGHRLVSRRGSRRPRGRRARHAPACAPCGRWSSAARRSGGRAHSGPRRSACARARRRAARARRGCSWALRRRHRRRSTAPRGAPTCRNRIRSGP